MTFLTPLAALVVLVVVVPLAAYALLRAARPPRFARLDADTAVVSLAAGHSTRDRRSGRAASPSRPRSPSSRARRSEVGGRTQRSSSCSTRRGRCSPSRASTRRRVSRARRILRCTSARASRTSPSVLPHSTDRALPDLFPTLDAQVFASTLEDSIGIERPPPSGTEKLATDFGEFGSIGANSYFKPQVSKRLLVIFSDGEPLVRREQAGREAARRARPRAVRSPLGPARENLSHLEGAGSWLPARSGKPARGGPGRSRRRRQGVPRRRRRRACLGGEGRARQRSRHDDESSARGSPLRPT